jgi:hypothetical protein
MQIKNVFAALSFGVVTGAFPVGVLADQFLNFGQMGAPNGVAFETYPSVTQSGGNTSLYTSNILAYFTPTGFTGTNRDQLEFWVGGAAGYSHAESGQKGTGWGVTSPLIGAEYYYNLIEPQVCNTCDGYSIYTISPIAIVTFPSGSRDTTGFKAGTNNYSYSLSVSNFLKFNRWSVSVNPFGVSYADKSRNETEISPGDYQKLQGGYSYTIADVSTGYDVTPDFGVGVHHVFRVNNDRSSDFERSKQGFIGPAFSYTGFGKHGLYLYANLNFNYYHSDNIDSAPYASGVLVQYF